MIFSVFLCLSAFMSEAYIEIFEQKYELIKFLNCGLFNVEERAQNNRDLIVIILGINTGIYIVSIVYYNLLNIFFIQENILYYVYVTFGAWFIYCFSLITGYRRRIRKSIDKKNNGNVKLSLFMGLLCTLLLKILKIDFSNISIDYLLKIINQWIKLEWYIFISLIFLFIISHILIYNHSNKESQRIDKKRIFKDIVKEFYEREVKNKLSIFIWILCIINFIDGSEIGKNLLITIIICFMFSIYNNRFMLNSDFLNYYYLVANDKLFIYICKIILVFPLSITIISTIILNCFDIKKILTYEFINVLFLFFNVFVGTIIYSYGFKIINEDEKKLSNVELINGIFYIIELLIVVNVLLK
ncbi:hypothetical protein [Gemella cuniculi]